MTNDKSPTPAVEGTMGMCCAACTPSHKTPHVEQKICVDWKPLAPSDSEGTKDKAQKFAEGAYALLSLGDHAKLPNTFVAVLAELYRNSVAAPSLNSVDTPAPVPQLDKPLFVCEFSDVPHEVNTHGRARKGACRDFELVETPETPEWIKKAAEEWLAKILDSLVNRPCQFGHREPVRLCSSCGPFPDPMSTLGEIIARHVPLSAPVPERTNFERMYRELLWKSHAGTTHFSFLYGDDGELQCSKCGLDFKRQPLAEIDKRLWEVNLARVAAPVPEPEPEDDWNGALTYRCGRCGAEYLKLQQAKDCYVSHTPPARNVPEMEPRTPTITTRPTDSPSGTATMRSDRASSLEDEPPARKDEQ